MDWRQEIRIVEQLKPGAAVMDAPVFRPVLGENPAPPRNEDADPAATSQRPASSLRDALKVANVHLEGFGTPSDSTSEEDYDDAQAGTRTTILLRRRVQPPRSADRSPRSLGPDDADMTIIEGAVQVGASTISETSSFEELQPLGGTAGTSSVGSASIVTVDDKEFRDMLRRGLQRAREAAPGTKRRRGKFSDLVFAQKFSAFDRQNEDAAKSPFHGFYTLFWLAVALFMAKIVANNWRTYGHPLGTNEIMQNMFRRDVIVLLASDGVMCALTGVSWAIQVLVYKNYLDWDRSGWIIQNIWQTMFIASFIGLTLIRDWPWTHTIFFVLHGLTMLMKQHSFAFYNGHLSTLYKQRADLLSKLKKLEAVARIPVGSPKAQTGGPSVSSIQTSHLKNPPSAAEMKERRVSMSVNAGPDGTDLHRIASAIESGKPLDMEQVHVFERILKWDVDALSDELQDKATSLDRAYPNNLTFLNHYEYIALPTLVYELEYPRSSSINWFYVAEKLIATFGIIFIMILLSQAFIYPVVMRTVAMKEAGVPLGERFAQFPWMLADLIFPFMMEYLLAWYLIWETILNILAEVTLFADRSFYDAWWNSVSWDQFARDWNRPVHNFLLRHVYHSSISFMKVNRHAATLITFFLSACVHELVMWCLFKKLRGYLLILQMFQLPLVRLSRTRWLKGRKTLGNIIFWLGIFTGPSLLCSLYLIL